MTPTVPGVYAVSDLHVGHRRNQQILLDEAHPRGPRDWLIVAGDVGERTEDIRWALTVLAERFAQVIWTPGNHELWTPRADPDGARGQARYEELVALCRDLGVLTPEDPYPRWTAAGPEVTVAPLHLLYDYTFLAPGTRTKAESLAYARRTGIVCSDEFFLDPDPFGSIEAWCAARVELTRRRLEDCADDRLVLVNHFPLVRQPTQILRHPEFAQWCGTVLTAQWHRLFAVEAVVYGHLHIPRTTVYDGVRFEEVSLGYPREWQPRPQRRPLLRPILPVPHPDGSGGGAG